MKESNRQRKFGRLIQKEMSAILQQEIPSMEIEGEEFPPMLTVTVVRSTPDLRIARIYVSVFPESGAEAAIEMLEEQTKEIRHLLAQRIRMQVRHIPEINFFLDDTAQEVAHMDKLFDEIKNKEEGS